MTTKERVIDTVITPETAFTAPKFIPDMSKAELASMALEKLSEALQAVNASLQPDLAIRIANATLDRTEGKPGQAITLDANIRQVTVNANIEFVQPNRDKVLQGVVDNVQVIDNK